MLYSLWNVWSGKGWYVFTYCAINIIVTANIFTPFSGLALALCILFVLKLSVLLSRKSYQRMNIHLEA